MELEKRAITLECRGAVRLKIRRTRIEKSVAVESAYRRQDIGLKKFNWIIKECNIYPGMK